MASTDTNTWACGTGHWTSLANSGERERNEDVGTWARALARPSAQPALGANVGLKWTSEGVEGTSLCCPAHSHWPCRLLPSMNGVLGTSVLFAWTPNLPSCPAYLRHGSGTSRGSARRCPGPRRSPRR